MFALLFCVACLLPNHRGGGGTLTWGRIPQGCEEPVTRSRLLDKRGGGGHTSNKKPMPVRRHASALLPLHIGAVHGRTTTSRSRPMPLLRPATSSCTSNRCRRPRRRARDVQRLLLLGGGVRVCFAIAHASSAPTVFCGGQSARGPGPGLLSVRCRRRPHVNIRGARVHATIRKSPTLQVTCWGRRAFTCAARGGGGVNRAPQNWGGGGLGKGPGPLISDYEVWRQRRRKIFPPNPWQMMTCLNPLDALIPKIPFSVFCRYLGPGHLRGLGVSLGRILGARQLSPF